MQSMHEQQIKQLREELDKERAATGILKRMFLAEPEDSEKMDEDNKIIEGLWENNEAISGQQEVMMTNNNELQKAKEVIDDLNRKVVSLRSTIDAKNVELLNLQTAFGQYYAEIEAKEHLERELLLQEKNLLDYPSD
ncbi:hypothetical protein Tco_0684990 [Tanacetum coccineum]